jgi:filamentous hemagglutinin family protein
MLLHRRSRLFATSALSGLASIMLWATPAHAQLVPSATQPATQSNGAAPVISQSGGTTDVTLGGSRTVIDWDRFDLQSGDTANFIFANRSDIVLNRVGGAASTINGDLNGLIGAGGPAGGNIWIYNANGVVIGAHARINTGGLLVTSAAVDRATDSSAGGFLDGSSTSFNFSGADTGSILVRNGAQITSRGGAIALVAPVVTTEAGSSISAQDGGNVLYGAANAYRISFRPTGTDDLDLISFEVANGADGTASTANSGDVLSLGGATSGNRVFAAVVSRTNIFSRLLSTGTITATTAALDETGAIVLTTNHNIVNGAASATAVANNGGADIALGNNAASTLTAPAITMLSSDSITTSAAMTAVGGTVDLTAENGVLWSNVQGIIAGTLTARSGASMQFTGSNAIDRIGGLTAGGDISLYSYGTSTDIAGDIVSPGKVSLNVSPASGSGVIRAAHAELSGEGSFNLDSATTLDYVYAIGNDLTVNSNGDLNLALTGTANDLGNRVILNAANGAIRQTAGSGGVLIGNVAANARDGIDLIQDNLFTSIAANSTGGGAINLKGAGGFGIAGSTTGTMTVTSPGTVTAGGTLDIGRLDINAAAIDLNRAALGTVNFGDLTTTSGGIAIATDSTVSFSGTVTAATGHDVSITSNLGAISQTAGTIRGRQVRLRASAGSILQDSSAAITSTGMGTDSFVAGGDLILAGANNIGVWGLTLDWGSGRDVTLRSATRLYFDGGATAIGALTLIADNGNIQQGNIAFTANSLTASATQGIDLGTSANNSIAHLGNIASSTGEIHLRVGANNPLAIDGTISSASRVVFTARGAVSGTGTFATPQLFLDLQSGGAINVAGSTNLLQLGFAGNTTVRASDSLTLSGTVAGNGFNLALIADSGSITQTGGSFLGVAALTATAASDISFGANNFLTNVSATSTGGGSITLNNGGAGALSVALNTTGSATVTTAGDLSSGGISVGSLSATAGHIDLTSNVAVNTFTGLVATYGDVLVTNTGSFTVAGDVSASRSGLRSVDLRASGGAISQTAGTISANDVRLIGAGDVTQSGTGRIDTAALSASGANLLLGGANNLGSTGTLTVGTNGNLTLRNAGSIDLAAFGGYTNGGALRLISDSGSISSANAVTAASLFAHAANGAISFTNSTGNQIAQIAGLTAGTNATVHARNSGFTLTGDIDVGGKLTLQAGSGINQTGGRIRAATLEANLYQTMTTGSVLLGGANDVDNVYVLAASGGGNVVYRDIDGFNVTYAVVGNRVTLTADSGAITQSSGVMDGIQANELSVSAVDGISLNNDWNGVRTILGLTNTGTGGINLVSRGGDMILGGNVAAAGQTVSLTAQNASISQTSGAITAGRLDVAARTGIALTQAGNNVLQLGTLSNSVSGGIAYTDANGYDIVGNINAAGQTLTLGSMDSAGLIRQASTGSLITAGTLRVTGAALAELRGPTGTYGNAIDAIGDVDTGLILNVTGAVDLRGNIVTDYLELRARGAVTQSGGRIENLDPVSQVSIRGASIALTSAANRLGWMEGLFADYGGSGIGDITLVSLGDIRLGDMRASDVFLTAGGNISTAGASQYRSIGGLAASSGGAIDFSGAIDRLGAITGTGGITLASSVDLVLTGIVNAGVDLLTLHSDGALSQTAGSITAGAIDASAGTGIDLGQTNFIFGLTGLSTTSGDITYSNWSNIMLPDVSAPGTLTLISETGSITQGAGTSVSASTLVATAADAIDLTGTNDIANLGALNASNAINVSTQGSLTLTDNISAGSVTLTSSTGSITQSGGTVATPTLTLRAGSDITLDRANAVGVFNAWAGIGDTVTLRNAGDLVVKAITAQNGTVNLTSNSGSVGQQVVPGYAIWTRTFNANAATTINLSQYNFVDTLGDLTAAGSIQFNNAGTIMLGGNIQAGGAFAMAVGGYIGQLTGTVTADHLDLTAAGIALMSANDIGSTNASHLIASDDITFHSANAILLGSVSTPGLLSLTSDSGDIRQIAAFSAGRLEAMAAGDILLDKLNTLDTVYDVTTGGVFSLRTAGALELDGRIAADDRVIFNTGGGLNQIGNTVIVTDRLEATAGAAASAGIRLLNHNRVGEISLNASGYDVRFRNTGDIAINAINAPTVELISNLGKITQQAAGGLVVGSLVLNAGNGVELYNADNQIARLDVVSRGNVSILTGGSGFGGLLTIDRIDAAGHFVGLSNSVNAITGGNITAERLNVFAVQSIDLGTANDIAGTVRLSSRDITFTNTGDLILEGLIGSFGNAVLRSEQGAISMVNNAVFATDGLTAYGRDGVVLGGGIRRIDALSAGPGADVFVASDYALDIAGDISARNVELLSNAQPGWYDATGGKITQSGGIITADRLIARARGDVTLDRSNRIAAVGWTVSTTGNVSITSTDALELTDAVTANGEVVLDAASINQSSGLIQAANLRARATGALSLDAVNQIAATGTVALDAGADIAFRNDGDFVLGMIDTPGTATFTSLNGSIGQAASTRIGAGRLTVSAANGGVTLDTANLIDTLGGLTAGGDVVFRNTADFALDGDIAAAGHEVTLRSNIGAITQTSGAITALGLGAEAGGAITLGGANNVTNLRDVTAGGDITYRNAGALMLWGDVTAAGHEVTLGTDSGSLLQMLFTGGIITANRLNASAGGALNFNHANRVNELGNYAAGSGLAGFTNDGSFVLTGDVSGDELALAALSGGIRQLSGTISTGSILATANESIDLSGANLVPGAGPIRLTSSNGNVTFRALGDFTLDFGSAAGTFDVTSNDGSIGQSGAITANRINARAGGNIALTSNNAVATLGFLTGEDIAFTAAGDLLLTDDIQAGGAVRLVAASGFIRQDAGVVTADRFAGAAGSNLRLGGANRIAALGDLAVGGTLWLENDAALTIEGAVSSALGVTIQSRSLTIGATGTVTSAAAGDAIRLASDGLFRNLGGGGALSASNGRWLVYSQTSGNAGASDPGNDFGGLAGKSFYGAAYDFEAGAFAAAPGAGNRFVYGYRPVLTVRPNDLVIIYDGQTPTLTAAITGLVNGDRAADAWSGAAALSGSGRNAGSYALTATLGTLESDMNYDFAFGAGTLRIDPRALIATLTAADRTYDGTTNATGTFGLAGLVEGDSVAATGSLAFDSRNAGTGKTVTASEIILTGADAGNYIVNGTATDLADIFARALTATLTANDRTYDGTVSATGALDLAGLVGGDSVAATGSLAFDSRNADTGKTVTASGIALTGADAGNYVVNTTATDLADIAARAIVATLTANDRTYDGTAGATGSLQLDGVIAGDTVGTSATLAFDTRNAGVDKTVTAGGIMLTGADAGNYIVNTTATDLADIVVRALTATLTANNRTYDGTTAATGALTLDGVIAGDSVGVNSGALTFDSRNAGSRTVTAGMIALTGEDAGNYVVNTTATDLADILARALTATFAANDRIYDGTVNATGALTIEGVLAGDRVAASGNYAFDNRNAGAGRTVTASGITLTGEDAGNYIVNATATDIADIAARAIAAVLAANDRTYDGTAGATGALRLDGVIAGDSIGTSATLAFDNRNAGTGRIVTASGITLTGADAGNYVVNTTATDLADIFVRAVTATLNANDRTYDGTSQATGALTLDGVVAGDSLGVSSGGFTFDSRNAGIRTATAGGIALTGEDAGNYSVNTTATDLADILARSLTVTLTANDRVYDGTTAATGTLELGGVIAGDRVGVAGTIAFDSRNAGDRVVTASGLTLGGGDAGNYTVAGTASDTATITRRAITGTAHADSRVYDGTIGATGRIALNGVIAGDTVSATAGFSFTNPDAGVGRAVAVSGLTFGGAEAGNYVVSLDGGPVTADILRRQVTVAADDLAKLFGQPDPALTYRISNGSLVGSDAFSGALSRMPGEQAGRYAIGQGSLGLSNNYLLTVVPGTLAINVTQSSADSGDAIRKLRRTSAFSLDQDPSANLEGDGD